MYWWLLRLGIPLLGALYAYGAGKDFMSTYSNNIQQVKELKDTVAKREGTLASYSRMIARRDAAINASKCKEQINKWVRKPEDIPQKFDPFNQLNPPNERH